MSCLTGVIGPGREKGEKGEEEGEEDGEEEGRQKGRPALPAHVSVVPEGPGLQ